MKNQCKLQVPKYFFGQLERCADNRDGNLEKKYYMKKRKKTHFQPRKKVRIQRKNKEKQAFDQEKKTETKISNMLSTQKNIRFYDLPFFLSNSHLRMWVQLEGFKYN